MPLQEEQAEVEPRREQRPVAAERLAERGDRRVAGSPLRPDDAEVVPGELVPGVDVHGALVGGDGLGPAPRLVQTDAALVPELG